MITKLALTEVFDALVLISKRYPEVRDILNRFFNGGNVDRVDINRLEGQLRRAAVKDEALRDALKRSGIMVEERKPSIFRRFVWFGGGIFLAAMLTGCIGFRAGENDVTVQHEDFGGSFAWAEDRFEVYAEGPQESAPEWFPNGALFRLEYLGPQESAPLSGELFLFVTTDKPEAENAGDRPALILEVVKGE